MAQMYEIEGGRGAQYPRDVVPRPTHYPAESYELEQIRELTARLVERGEHPMFIPVPGPGTGQRPAVDGEVVKWLGLSVAAIVIAALGFVACANQPPSPVQTVHKPSCVAVC